MAQAHTNVSFDNFSALDIRVGTVIQAVPLESARKPAYKMHIDFGEIGIKKTSAQITDLYAAEELIDRKVIAIVNFEPKQIGNFMSECLVLGGLTGQGVALLGIDSPAENGDRIA